MNDDCCFKPVSVSHLPLAAGNNNTEEDRIQDSQFSLSKRRVKAWRFPGKHDTGAALPFLTTGIRSQEPTDLRMSAVPGRWHVNTTELAADPIAYDVHVVGK